MKRAWDQRGKRLLSIPIGLFLFKPDLEKKKTLLLVPNKLNLAKWYKNLRHELFLRGEKKTEKRSAAFTLRVQKVKTKFTLKKNWSWLLMYNFRDLRVRPQKRRKVHNIHKSTEARCWHYSSCFWCCLVLKNSVFRNLLTKYLSQSRQQWTNQLCVTWTVSNKLKDLSDWNCEEIWSSLMA